MKPSTHPHFWRDQAMPYVELRHVLDGRAVSYAPHFHKEWSIGAILNGQSEFMCANRLHEVERGTLVMMDPDVVHACNPKQDSAWAYYMMHVDKDWLATLVVNTGVRSEKQWQDTHLDILTTAEFYQAFVVVCDCLMSATFSPVEKTKILQDYLVKLFTHIGNTEIELKPARPLNNLYLIANYLNQHCLEDTSIELISAKFNLSSGYLIRAFKRQFTMTPHAYRLNCRVQLGQQALKSGETIAHVAHAVGFSDQAHFQRVFKQRVAATPKQYRHSVS